MAEFDSAEFWRLWDDSEWMRTRGYYETARVAGVCAYVLATDSPPEKSLAAHDVSVSLDMRGRFDEARRWAEEARYILAQWQREGNWSSAE